MSEPASEARFPDVSAAIQEQRLPLPLVAIDGELRLAGSAHYIQVFPLVEQALAEDRVPSPAP